MKKKLISALAVSALMLPAVMGLTACKKDNPKGINVRDAYAMSALSSISYLANQDSSPNTLEGTRPTNITQFDVDGIKNSLSMFDTTINNGGFLETVKNNTSTEDLLKDYKLQMDISFPATNGSLKVCTMYYTEINTKTNTELDEGVKEIETSTTFEGVISYDSDLFIVRGETEIETEGKETEYSISFRTYKNASSAGINEDKMNYVKIEQSFENDEVEYEYTLVNNGKIEVEMELEYEQNRNGSKVEFELIDRNIKQLTKYTLYKGNNENQFVVTVNKNGNKETINVTKQANGKYTFAYTGGYSETV